MIEKSEGEKLAKVLWYYNLVPAISSSTEKIICPFHEDANPSLLVNYEDGSWFCFGCQQGGNASKFVKLMEQKYSKANDLQAYNKYLKILKSDKCSSVTTEHILSSPERPKKDLYNEAYDYYHGLSKINWCQSGASDDISKFKDYMTKRGFTSTVLELCKAKITYNRNYGLIFPMLDNGKFKGWVCRTTIAEVEKRRKYLYNEGFRRRTTLVGNYGHKEYLIVVEGYMDRLKFIQFGEDSVVAILGWKMSQEQIQKIKEQSNIKCIISALDNDKCGKKGSAYLSKVFGDKYMRFSYLKGVKDPGEMTQVTFNKMFRRTMKNYTNNFGGKSNGISRQDQK